MFDAGKFRRTKAQECGRFAAAAVDVDDRLFWSKPSSGWSLRAAKRKRSADASSVSFRVIDNLPRVEFWRRYDCFFAAARAPIASASRSAIPARPDFSAHDAGLPEVAVVVGEVANDKP
jgi:hypothetical protein